MDSQFRALTSPEKNHSFILHQILLGAYESKSCDRLLCYHLASALPYSYGHMALLCPLDSLTKALSFVESAVTASNPDTLVTSQMLARCCAGKWTRWSGAPNDSPCFWMAELQNLCLAPLYVS